MDRAQYQSKIGIYLNNIGSDASRKNGPPAAAGLRGRMQQRSPCRDLLTHARCVTDGHAHVQHPRTCRSLHKALHDSRGYQAKILNTLLAVAASAPGADYLPINIRPCAPGGMFFAAQALLCKIFKSGKLKLCHCDVWLRLHTAAEIHADSITLWMRLTFMGAHCCIGDTR
jgi:hypothetical protein